MSTGTMDMMVAATPASVCCTATRLNETPRKGPKKAPREQWADTLRAAVEAVERKAAAERQATGRKVLGRKAVLRQSPYSCPKSCSPRRRLRPRVASRYKWRCIELLQADKRCIRRYKDCLEARRGGASELDVVFPLGTYKLRRLGLARCEGAPQSAPAAALM